MLTTRPQKLLGHQELDVLNIKDVAAIPQYITVAIVRVN
jgi:hypothetical protein